LGIKRISIIFLVIFILTSCYQFKEKAEIFLIVKQEEDYWKFDYYNIFFKTESGIIIEWCLPVFHNNDLGFKVKDKYIISYSKVNSEEEYYSIWCLDYIER